MDQCESRISVDGASLYAQTIGQGQPVIVLHGGPDFDHRYLLPDPDRWPHRIRSFTSRLVRSTPYVAD